ncbi:MAG: MgtC/SapB family protein [Gemmatimonadaceae bacterium]|nr:MgtC/SapB family protein [Gemmatimonadota bacterium]MCC7323975.1 MgtC/SapB family protein [Gemmatimonadaceae bacterium]
MTQSLIIRLAIAALVGLAVGIERERSGHGSTGAHPRFAGVRTFLVIGGVGGAAGWLQSTGSTALAVSLLAGASLLTAAAYWSAARAGGADAIDGTTEMAALLVLALGTLAGMGEMAVAGGAGALLVLALSEKAAIHGAVARLGATELRAAMQFAVLALIVLPVLPNQAYGPLGGINPRTLWIVVLIFSGLNFAGFLARRAVGASRGYGVTGALGGVISSTAVTLQFSRMSRLRPALAGPLAIGTIAASTVLLPRVLLLSAALAPPVALALLPYLAPPFLAGALVVTIRLVQSRHDPRDGDAEALERSPLRLFSAIQMAVAFQLALMAIEYARLRFGSPGVLVSAALLGLTDMDALTLSMNRLGRAPSMVPLAAQAIAVGVSANAVTKLVVALVLGGPRYRAQAALGLGALLTAGAVTIILLAR